MRLGGAIFKPYTNGYEWAERVREKGYRAAICPLDATAPDAVIEEYKKAAAEADIVIGEVGVWNNPMHPDPRTRKEAVEFAKRQLLLAEKIEARCCVNITGTYNPDVWYGPHPENFTRKAFDEIVQTTREIIDAVGPVKTFYTFEPSAWLYPDSIETYLELLDAVNRPALAVHWDPVNMMYSPRTYYQNAVFLTECIQRLGPYMKSCHLKDLYMDERFTLYVQERMSGDGILDYPALIRELDRLDPDMPAFVEHMETEEEYDRAGAYVKSVMAQVAEESQIKNIE